MNKEFRITVQRTFFGADEIITKENRISQFECDKIIRYNRERILITKDNIKIIENSGLKKSNGDAYKEGDYYESPLESITYEDNGIEKNVSIWLDPYWKVEKFIDGKFQKIEGHNCGHDHLSFYK